MAAKARLARELKALLEDAEVLAGDASEEVEAILREGLERPLTERQAERLLAKVVRVVRHHAEELNDRDTAEALSGETFLKRVLATRRRLPGTGSNGHKGGARGKSAAARARPVRLVPHNGIKPQPVFPRPTFHGREVPMNAGFVKVRDIQLWAANERLGVHVRQFQEKHGRRPTGDEVLDIMLSRLPLPGVEKDDQFKIKELARSIANNGVRRAPVIDLDGTLWDGNRRVASSHYIFESDEFSAEQRARAEWVFVWQFTEHATDEDRNLVMVSLNFEPDHKEDWPTYVRAQKVYEEWQRMLALEPRAPTRARQLEIMREVSQAFALGPRVTTVQRYIRMVEWATDFEEHQISVRRRDEFEVKHRATEKFEYFDELSKGPNAGGVAHTLTQDDALKGLAFDLLFENKFKNFTQIRDLKHVPANADVHELLLAARKEPDEETAQIKVDDALSIVKQQRAEKRRLGANSRIEGFVEFIEQLPLASPRDQIKPENLEALLRAMVLVRQQAIKVLGKKKVEEILGDG